MSKASINHSFCSTVWLLLLVVAWCQPAPTLAEAERSTPPSQPEAPLAEAEPGALPAQPPLAIAPFNAEQARAHQEAWAKHLRIAVELANSIGMEFVLIPPGEYMMGSPESELYRGSAEGPQHRVRITRPFYFGVYEVTQGQYEQVIGGNPSMFRKVPGHDTSRFPVDRVSWYDAVEFCRKLSAIPAEISAGRVYRLPTEAEWEYACRAGTTTQFHFGSVMDGRQANYASYPGEIDRKAPRVGRTTTVGSYNANAFGLFDMHGNVAEWCADWFSVDYYSQSPIDDPQGPESGWARIYRGGAHQGRGGRSASRDRTRPHARSDILAFRAALEFMDEPSR
ncbi:MAG: formylglycine-generating enzyme family protein [Patescibacteria group bacterium]|nr:formylglycine-generating enzyme family protein [Patescibacteria group bacterium]